MPNVYEKCYRSDLFQTATGSRKPAADGGHYVDSDAESDNNELKQKGTDIAARA
jgi:hypothetical protein